ncbi:MAG: IS4 family transposase [Phaeodactylibacter sp.]|nr:IS4 family transposase [Phaeodactylibacter sp.]
MKTKDFDLHIDGAQLWESLEKAFGHDFEALARESGFISRSSSRLSGEMMCYLNTCLFGDTTGSSLNDLCAELYDKFGVKVKKQSLDERFNTYTVKFMEALYRHSFQHYGSSLLPRQFSGCAFSQVKIIDATSISLPENLSAFYVGSGGAASAACAKIHHCFELLEGKTEALYLTDGASSDTSYWDSGQFTVSPAGLVIFDLGYWRCAQLAAIAQQDAYFLTRYKANTSLYSVDRQSDLLDLMALLKGVDGTQEHTVLIGQQKVAARLIVEAVPRHVKEQRLEKLREDSRRKGRKSNTTLRKQMCGYNIWLTNAPSEWLEKDQAREYYSLRWQIELIFKIWKSLLDIGKVGQMNIFRFECYLYGSLMAILFSTEILSFLQQQLIEQPETPIELSGWKAIKMIKKKSR